MAGIASLSPTPQAEVVLGKELPDNQTTPVGPSNDGPSQLLPDDENPLNFSKAKKRRIVLASLFITINSALGSSLPSGATKVIARDFSVRGSTLPVLLTSIYLIGFALGPLVAGPLSEHLGRRPVFIWTFAAYCLFTLCCAVSPTFPALLVFRFLCGLAAATPNAVIGPLYADIYNDPTQRGRVMAYFMSITSASPPFGPIISGYSALYSWRLAFWVALALGLASLPLIVTMPETYAPVIAKKREKRERREKRARRREEKDKNAVPSNTCIDVEVAATATRQQTRDSTVSLPAAAAGEVKVIFARPFVMIVQEPVVFFTSLYLALIYSILYLFFQAYPIVFTGVYGLSPGEVGLCMLPISAGSFGALSAFLWYQSYHSRALDRGEEWAVKTEFRRLPLACAGGPFFVISLIWLGVASKPHIHPAAPSMSGFLFGVGYQLIFMAMLNYLGDAYRQLSASAQSAASTSRSIIAVCLPLAATPMYGNLGIPWACSTLALLTLAMVPIPFVFIRYGERIRRGSPFYQKLLEMDSFTPTPLRTR